MGHPRRGVRRRAVAAAGVAVACAVALAGCGSGPATAAAAASGGGGHAAAADPAGQVFPNIGTSVNQALPKRLLDMPLTDAAGKTVRLSDFAGKTIVLQDMMTLCQETCPLDTATTVQTARQEDKAGHSNVVYLSITIDPRRDTVPQIAAYRDLYTPVPGNWYTLTGKPADITALWKFLGVWIKKTPDDDPAHPPRNWRTGTPLTYDLSHTDAVFFLDSHQRERFVIIGTPVTAKSIIPPTLYSFMSADGHHNVAHPPSTAWTAAQAKKVIAWTSRN